jgi:hypothetical protein
MVPGNGCRIRWLATMGYAVRSAPMPLIREIRQNGKADVVLGKSLRVLPEAERLKPFGDVPGLPNRAGLLPSVIDGFAWVTRMVENERLRWPPPVVSRWPPFDPLISLTPPAPGRLGPPCRGRSAPARR